MMSGPSYSSANWRSCYELIRQRVSTGRGNRGASWPGVVIAGAGSGKTETMAARVVWLVANRMVEPERTRPDAARKAAAELGRQSDVAWRSGAAFSKLMRQGSG